MSAVFSACCACGASVSAPCPTLGEPDMASAHAAIEAAGFVWDDRLGYRCGGWPACEADPVPAAAPPEPPQADLFAETAA